MILLSLCRSDIARLKDVLRSQKDIWHDAALDDDAPSGIGDLTVADATAWVNGMLYKIKALSR